MTETKRQKEASTRGENDENTQRRKNKRTKV